MSMLVFPVPALPMIAMQKSRSGSGETICSWILRTHKKAGGFTRNAEWYSMTKRMMQRQLFV
jgi:hypothetical protein